MLLHETLTEETPMRQSHRIRIIASLWFLVVSPLAGQSPSYLRLITLAGDSSLLVFRHANVRGVARLTSGDSAAASIAAGPIYLASNKIDGWRGDLEAVVPTPELALVHRQIVEAVSSLAKAASASALHAEHCKSVVLNCDEAVASARVLLDDIGAEFDYIKARNRLSRMITDLGGHLDSLPPNFAETDDPDPMRRPHD